MNEQQAHTQVQEIVSHETMEDFMQLQQALIQWSKRFNLVAPSSVNQFWLRHVLDSVQLFDLAPKPAKMWLDFGSGAGFPGIILAVLLKSRIGARVQLIESNGKKCAFLRHCARQLQAPADILQDRIEQIPTQKADVITARALTDVSGLLAFSERFVGSKTILLFPKGKNVKEELTKATQKWDIELEQLPSITNEQASILRITKMGRI